MDFQNRLLSALSSCERAHLAARLERVPLRRRQTLYHSSQVIRHAYFIEGGAASIVARTRDTAPMEISIVGNRGFIGVPLLLGSTCSPFSCVVQIPGTAYRLSSEQLAEELARSPRLATMLLRYVHALIVQQGQLNLCNSKHGLTQRLARWLLMVSDRTNLSQIPVTHDLMARMLGVRRPGVTLCLGALRDQGLLELRRGGVRIVDSDGLAELACQCLSIIRNAHGSWARPPAGVLLRDSIEDLPRSRFFPT